MGQKRGSSKYIKWSVFNTAKQGYINEYEAMLGSGKTTAIKKYIRKTLKRKPNTRILVLSPFILSNDEYKPLAKKMKEKGHVLELDYFTSLASDIAEKVLGPRDWGQRYEKACSEYFRRYDIVILDEMDYFTLQAGAGKVITTVETNKGYKDEISSNKAYYFMLQGIASSCLCIAVSANRMVLPENYDDEVILTHKVSARGTVKISKLTIVDLNGLHKNNWSRLREGLLNQANTSEHKTLLFSPRFSKSQLLQLAELHNVMGIFRLENVALTTDVTTGGMMPVGSKDSASNFRIISNDCGIDTTLKDEMFDTFKVIAINSSSSRAVSLTNQYAKPKVMIFCNHINATVVQVMGRFRLSPVEVIIVTDAEDVLAKLCIADRNFMRYLDEDAEITVIRKQHFKKLGIPYRKKKKNAVLSKAKQFEQWYENNYRSCASDNTNYQSYEDTVTSTFSSKWFRYQLRMLSMKIKSN